MPFGSALNAKRTDRQTCICELLCVEGKRMGYERNMGTQKCRYPTVTLCNVTTPEELEFPQQRKPQISQT